MKKLSNISESVWGNISKRAEGNIERKEDDVNMMDGENFANYLNKRYSFKDEHKIEYNETLNIMTIPGLCAGDEFCDDNVGVDYTKDSSTIIYMWINDSALSEQVRSVLKKKFKLSVRGTYTFLFPLDGGKLTNKFVVNVLDYMADLDMDDINIRRAVCESVWGNISKRTEGTLDRKEDTLKTNVNELKLVDLGSNVPVYFADRDLEVNGEVKFTWEEVKGFIQKIEETGWELPAGPKGMQSIFYNGNQPPRFRDDAYEKKWVPFVGGTLTSNENDTKLFFPSDNYYLEVYWCVDDNYKKGDLDTYSLKFGASKRITQRSFIVGDPNDFNGCLIRTNNEMVERKCRVRLIKDK